MSNSRHSVLLAFLGILLSTTGTSNLPCQINSKNGPINIRGMHYIPSTIGYEPSFDPYDSYYHPIHMRDIPLIKRVSNTIRISSISMDLNDNHTKFFELIKENNMNVIFTFSLKNYHLFSGAQNSGHKLREETKSIMQNLEKFINNHKKYSSIIMWCLGGIDDDYFNAESIDPIFNGQLSLLLKLLIRTIKETDTLNRKISIGVTGMIDSIVMQQVRSELNFDCFILRVMANEPHRVEYTVTKALLNNSKPLIIQFSASAWDRFSNSEKLINQSQHVQRILEVLNRTKLTSHIYEEWSDQWFRGDTAACGWERPYYHSPCGFIGISEKKDSIIKHLSYSELEYQGMNSQFELYGSHCIRVRDALATYSKKQVHSKVPFKAGKTFCQSIYPYFFRLEFDNPMLLYGLAPAVILGLFDVVLWYIYQDRKSVV